MVEGNYIGTDVNSDTGLGNSYGVYIWGGQTGNTIGGASANARNIISGNNQYQVQLQVSGTRAT